GETGRGGGAPAPMGTHPYRQPRRRSGVDCRTHYEQRLALAHGAMMAPMRIQWPGQPHQPRPRIPLSAEERVVGLDEAGRKAKSEFWLRGALVGRASWNPDGSPHMAVGVRQGVEVGHRLEYHEDGTIYAEPFVEGVLHGLAKQYHPDGTLLIVSPFRNGTGTDCWCDLNGTLAEEDRKSVV